RFSRRESMIEEERKELAKEEKRIDNEYAEKIATQFREFIEALGEVLDKKELKDPNTGKVLGSDKDDKVVAEQAKAFKLENLDIRSPDKSKQATKIHGRHW